jgi:translation elongation factor EF-Ts
MLHAVSFDRLYPGKGGRAAMTNQEFLRDFQEKVEKKLRENEIAVVQYWRERLGRAVSMKPDRIASLQMEIKRIYDMMEKRIQTLKKG